MSDLANRSKSALSVGSKVVFVARSISYLDVRFGPSRVRMEALESRRHLNAGGVLEFNGIPLPEYESNWATVVALDESGYSLEATAEDGSVVQLDLMSYEDGSQCYDFSMASTDPEILYMTGDGTDGSSEGDPGVDTGEMFENVRNVALADFNNWGVTELNVDDNGVVTAMADGEARTVTLADGDRGVVLVDGVGTGYELQQGRENGWTLVNSYEILTTDYFGEQSVTLADFNGWGVTELTITDGILTVSADGVARTVSVDEGGMISVDGAMTSYMFNTDGVNSGLMLFYTLEDNYTPGENDGGPIDYSGEYEPTMNTMDDELMPVQTPTTRGGENGGTNAQTDAAIFIAAPKAAPARNSVAIGFFASKSIVDAEDQSVI